MALLCRLGKKHVRLLRDAGGSRPSARRSLPS